MIPGDSRLRTARMLFEIWFILDDEPLPVTVADVRAVVARRLRRDYCYRTIKRSLFALVELGLAERNRGTPGVADTFEYLPRPPAD